MRLVFKKIITGALVALFMVPASLMVAPQQSNALTANIMAGAAGATANALVCLYGGAVAGAVVSAVGGLFGGVMGGAEVPTINSTINYRECIMDAFAWELTNALIRAITDDMVAWIESGFQGGPVFLTDYKGFFREVGDLAAGRFIQENLEFVCSPFKLNLQLSLAARRGARIGQPEQFQCRLSEVVENIDEFMAGDFSAGGWDGWFTMASNRASNPINAVLDADYAMQALILNEQGQQFDLLEWGRGFFSIPTEGSLEIIGRPGVVIETALNNTFDNSARRLVAADEIGEVLSALAGYFINEVILGNSEGLATGGRSYLARAQAATMGSLQTTLLNEADAAIASAQDAGDTDGAARLTAIRDEIEGLDMSNPDDVARLQGLRNQLISATAQSIDYANSPGGSGATGDIGTLPPYDNPGIADEPNVP